MRAATIRERIVKLRHERNALQRQLGHKLFPLFQRVGFHLLGDHFYEPVPNTRHIAKTYRDEPRLDLRIDYRYEKAESFLLSVIQRWGGEFYADATRVGYSERNHFFRGLDGITLYCLIRELRPMRIIEIGQGMSTRIAAAALGRVGAASELRPALTTVDPHPRLDSIPKIPRVEIDMLRSELQDLPLEIFRELRQNELLFIDSSHVYKFGSDVAFAFERIFPSLSQGVIVHIHDIFSPYPYPMNWYVERRRFWNEQHFLEQLISGGGVFNVLLPVNYISRESGAIRALCRRVCNYSDYKHEGSSMYLEVETALPGLLK